MSLLKLSRALCALILAANLSGAAFAAPVSKDYTVTAPDGVKLAVQESGDPKGPPVVFIHGLLGSRLNWDKQVHSEELQHFHLITYDLRGHGLSDKPTDASAYTDAGRWADDLNAVIQEAHVRRPLVVGWSLGGTVISNYLAQYGDSGISGAVYVDGVVELKAGLIVPHPALFQNLVSTDLTTHLDAIRTFLGLCFYAKPDTATFERLLENAAMASWDMQSKIQQLNVNAAQGLTKAHVPVLLIYGAHDALVEPRATITRAKELDPNIESKLYSGSGHAPFSDEAKRFNQDIAAFATRVEQLQ